MTGKIDANIVPPISGFRSTGHSVGQLRKIPIVSNNSCLFSCFNLLLHRNQLDIQQIRDLTAATIEADVETFNDVTLDKPRWTYIEWIRQPESWGGYIELIALSRVYSIHVVVFDIKSGREDQYGDVTSGQRIYLVYDGLHYDALVAEDACCAGGGTGRDGVSEASGAATATPKEDTCIPVTHSQPLASASAESFLTIFDPNDSETYLKARAVAAECQKRKALAKANEPAHAFECSICHTVLPGRQAIQAHAAATGHTRYGERGL